MDELLRSAGERLDQVRALLTICAVALAATRPGSRFFRNAWQIVRRLSRRRWAVPVTVGVASLLASSPLVWLRVPQPLVHDEFSYLLAADTFASGRLTNPTPPLWPAFETMHTIFGPSYQSKYPPGQGLSLAAGKVLTGRFVAGAWATAALACAAVAWFLLAVVPSRWALVGGLIAAVHPRVLYWGQNYWGGQLAMLGGALLLGGAVRVARRGPQVTSGLAIGGGLSILALSRPGEGLLFSVIVLGWLAGRLVGQRADLHGVALRLLVPATLVLGPTFAWLGYYNWRVTGDATTLPYVEFVRQYGVAPPYVFQPLRPTPEFHSDPLRELQAGWEVAFWRRHQTPTGYAAAVVSKLYVVARDADLLGVLGLPLIAAVLALRRDRTARLALLGGGAFLGIVVLTQTWTMIHYVAPAAGLLALLLVVGLRRLRAWQRGTGLGRILSAAVLVSLIVSSLAYALPAARSWGWQYDRQRLIDRLVERGGRHLVVVRYGPDHDIMREWVANSADIDSQAVVFAHDLSPAATADLVGYFAKRGRRAWLLQPDVDFFRLEPLDLTDTPTPGDRR